MLTSAKKQQGVTLIELMIAVVITAIAMAIAAPSYRNWIQNTKIRSMADSIQNGLQVARNEAVRRNASVQFLLAGTGWTVSCVAVTPGCPDTNPIQSRATGESSSANVMITDLNGTTVIFNNFGAMTTPAVATATFNIDVPTMPAAQSRDLRVTVDAGGNVRMCDPNRPSTDPRVC